MISPDSFSTPTHRVLERTAAQYLFGIGRFDQYRDQVGLGHPCPVGPGKGQARRARGGLWQSLRGRRQERGQRKRALEMESWTRFFAWDGFSKTSRSGAVGQRRPPDRPAIQTTSGYVNGHETGDQRRTRGGRCFANIRPVRRRHRRCRRSQRRAVRQVNEARPQWLRHFRVISTRTGAQRLQRFLREEVTARESRGSERLQVFHERHRSSSLN